MNRLRDKKIVRGASDHKIQGGVPDRSDIDLRDHSNHRRGADVQRIRQRIGDMETRLLVGNCSVPVGRSPAR